MLTPLQMGTHSIKCSWCNEFMLVKMFMKSTTGLSSRRKFGKDFSLFRDVRMETAPQVSCMDRPQHLQRRQATQCRRTLRQRCFSSAKLTS
jgi:LSD1 subclass zinc finger protein